MAVLIPLAVGAQQTTTPGPIELTVGGQNRRIVGPGDCGTRLIVNFQINTQTAACSAFQVWLTSAMSCENGPPEGAPIEFTLNPGTGGVFPQFSGNFTIPVTDFPVFKNSDGGVLCGTTPVQADFRVCGAFEAVSFGGCQNTTSNTVIIKEATPPTVGFDNIPPAAPVLDTVEALDSSIAVRFSVDTDTASVVVTARNAATNEVAAQQTVVLPSTSANLTGLENNVTFLVSAVGQDEAGNQSPTSNTIEGTPVQTCGFGCELVNSGGEDAVGCSTAGGAALGILGLLSGAFLFARRRWTWR